MGLLSSSQEMYLIFTLCRSPTLFWKDRQIGELLSSVGRSMMHSTAVWLRPCTAGCLSRRDVVGGTCWICVSIVLRFQWLLVSARHSVEYNQITGTTKEFYVIPTSCVSIRAILVGRSALGGIESIPCEAKATAANDALKVHAKSMKYNHESSLWIFRYSIEI